MTTTEDTVTFVVPESFEKALRLIRRALTDEAISIATELDISGRIRRALGVDVGPCRILCVDSPFLLLQAMTLDDSTVASLPLHVAVSVEGQRTVVHVLSQSGSQGCASPLGAKSVVSKFQAGLSRALEKIAVRQGLAHQLLISRERSWARCPERRQLIGSDIRSLKEDETVFHTIDDRIRQTQPSAKERCVRYLAVSVLSALVLGVLCFALIYV